MARADDSQRVQRHWDRQAELGTRSEWTQNNLVAEHVYGRISGGAPKFWLNWLFEDHLQRRFSRALSIGCGTGDHELIMASLGLFDHIDAFDLSEHSVRLAAKSAQEKSIDNVNFFCSDFGSFRKDLPAKKYDLVCFFGSLHHVRDLEDMLQTVSDVLSDDGLVAFNEYMGDCYTIISRKKAAIVNRLLDRIDDSFINKARPRYINPTIRQMLDYDPSEATRSALLMPFLEYYFDFLLVRPFGGALMHSLYPSLCHEKVNDGSPESRTIMKLLLETELLLEEAGALTSDFYVGVCRKKR